MKKLVELRGKLEHPLTIGCAAFIKPADKDAFRTSTVKHFVKLPSGAIYIETRNTHYLLLPVKEKVSQGVAS